MAKCRNPNCEEPLHENKERGPVRVAICPECGKEGCTICVEMTETETCCCSPYAEKDDQ